MPYGIPLWKLRREFTRLTDQLLDLPDKIANLRHRLSEPARRAVYERDFDRLTRLNEGQVPLKDRVAIFLIYQPTGVAPSVLGTCKWLAAEGYSPFVVSNGSLEEADRRQIEAESWRLLERPNFGYDFGGYRDAILLLDSWGLSPDRLIVMNDSVWTPMVPDLMLLLEAQAEEADIVGFLKDEKVRHDTEGGQPTERFHLESYFYLITQTALSNPAFRGFWQSYRMTNFKPSTIKHGEIGFSRRMSEAGLRLEALTRRSLFIERLARMDDCFLVKTLRYAIYTDHDLGKAATRLAQRNSADTTWRGEALEHIRRTVNRKRFNVSFPYANDHIFGTIFMKKSLESIFCGMRQSYLRALSDGEVAQPPPEVLIEIKAITAANRKV